MTSPAARHMMRVSASETARRAAVPLRNATAYEQMLVKMSGNIEHTGGKLTSNGVQVDDHAHGNVQSGGSWTKGTQ